jgi:transcriptional regulator with XRE-family HTH domain
MTPLKHIRKSRGMTAAGVAAALSMDQGHYTKIENGASTSAATAAKIAAYFAPAITEIHVLYPDRFPRETPSEAA